MIDWSKVDWEDVGIHAGASLLIVGLLMWGGLLGLLAALLNGAFWYVREANQHTERGPWVWQWGWGSQMEFYAPLFTGFLVAAIASVW